MKNYTFLGKSDGRRFCIEGVDVFSHKWQSLGTCDIVIDPDTRKPHSFSSYKIISGTKEVGFLAGKTEDDKWNFYQLSDDNDEE